MKPKFPYPGHYYISQQFNESSLGYHHFGVDIVPLDKPGGNHWPAPIFPILSGKTLSVANTDKDRGKGIRVRTLLTAPFVAYLKSKKLVPANYGGSVYLDCLYWHCLMVTDLDGTITQNTPVGITGNTGNVYAGGQPVPDYMKGVPPYPGLHLHLEAVVTNGVTPFNTDKDQWGRVDPLEILNYQGDSMGQFKTQNFKGELRIVLQADSIENWKELCKVYGVDPSQVDETIN